MDVPGTLLNVVLIGGALFIVGPAIVPLITNLTTQLQAAGAPPAAAPAPTVDANGNPVPAPAPAPLPTNTGNPIQDLVNAITNQQGGVTPPGVAPPAANPSLCKSKYFGKCDTECKGGNSSNCQACRAACGLTSSFARAYSAIFDDYNMPPSIGYKMTVA
jgi:hypothetical protein